MNTLNDEELEIISTPMLNKTDKIKLEKLEKINDKLFNMLTDKKFLQKCF